MDKKAVMNRVSNFFKENPELEGTISKDSLIESEDTITLLSLNIQRRTFDSIKKSRKKELTYTELTKMIIKAMLDTGEKYGYC